jgi:hypothetical protein
MVFFIDTDLYNGSFFVVENGVTARADFNAARQAGKTIFAKVDGGLLPMSNENGHEFKGIINDRLVTAETATPTSDVVGLVVVYHPAYAKQEDTKKELENAVARENILTNACFLDPVNQRGATSYTGDGYCIDRWFIDATSGSGREVTLAADTGITLGSGTYLIQRIPGVSKYLGRTLTVSALLGNGELVTATATVPSQLTGGVVYMATATAESGFRIRLGRNTNSGWLYVELYAASGSATVKAAKLEVGDFQTLAVKNTDNAWVLKDPPPVKTDEAEHCKWYFERVKAVDSNLTIGMGSGASNKLYCGLKMSPKRTAPSAEALAACVGSLRYGTNTLANTPTKANLYSFDPESGYCTLELSGTITAGTAYRVGIATGGYLDFDCEV